MLAPLKRGDRMIACVVCGAPVTGRRRDARKCPPDTPCWHRRRRRAALKYRAAHRDDQRAYFRAYRAATRAYRRVGGIGAARALERAAIVRVGVAAVAARQAIRCADADRAMAGNRAATATARAHARGRLDHADQRVTDAIVARDTLIDQSVADVDALRAAAWDALSP